MQWWTFKPVWEAAVAFFYTSLCLLSSCCFSPNSYLPQISKWLLLLSFWICPTTTTTSVLSIMALDFLICESFWFEHSTITTTSPTTSTTILVLSYSYYCPTLTTTVLLYYCLFENICGGLLSFWFDLWLTVILLLLLYSYSTTTLSTTTIYYYYNLSNTYACIWQMQWWLLNLYVWEVANAFLTPLYVC
jgi:hypothetical protein